MPIPTLPDHFYPFYKDLIKEQYCDCSHEKYAI